MNEEQKKKAVNWFQNPSVLAQPMRCEACHAAQWDIAEHLVMPMSFHEGGNIVIGGGPSYPQVMLICRKCGNTKFFNAVKLGILSNQDGGGNGQ